MKLSVTDKRQFIVNTVLIALVLFLGVYAAVQLSRNLSGGISTLRTQQIKENQMLIFDGYIFRDEEIIYSEGAGVADLSVGEGEKVGSGKEYAKLYTSSSMSDKKLAETKNKLYELTLKIRLLEQGLSNGGDVADFDKIQRALLLSYSSYINAVASSDFVYANSQGDELFAHINDYMLITGRIDQTQARELLSQLKSEKEELLMSVSSSPVTLTAQSAGYFYTVTDGYENVSDYGLIDYMLYPDKYQAMGDTEGREKLTAKRLSEIIASEREYYGTNAVGKIMYSSKWYLAVPTVGGMGENFTCGKVYELSFTDNDDQTVSMTLEYNNLEEGLMIFSSRVIPDALSSSRCQRVKAVRNTVSGYRVPEQSVIEISDGGTKLKYVYVLTGNTVEMRRITVKYSGNGYYIVNTYEEDYAEGNERDVPYLSENELIIISGTDLYDGKILK